MRFRALRVGSRAALPCLVVFLLAAAAAHARPILSPALNALERNGTLPEAFAISDVPGVGQVLDVFLEGNVDEAALRDLGVVVGTRLPNGIRTARVPLDRVGRLAAVPGLTRIAAAPLAKKHLDVSTPNTQVTPNYWTSSPPNFTGSAGQGVIVGIVDTGIDWSHDDFKKPDGTTRILFIWDQNAAGTPPPGYGYGMQWTASDIDNGFCTHVDTDGHGTHVAGISAGDGSATGNGQPANRFIGMAPRADIIMVATTFSTAAIVDGVNYIFQQAALLGQPAVVNLSLGSQFGAHDGTETFDTAMDALTGAGRIVVASAGNDGAQSLHAEQLVPPGGAQTITFSIPSYTANGGAANDYVVIDAYYDGTDNMQVTLTSPGPTPVTVGPVNLGASATNSSAAGYIYIENGVTPSPSGDRNIYIEIYDAISTRRPRPGTWTLTLTPVSTTPATECDAWLATFQLGNAGVQPLFTSDVDEAELVGSPGTATQVVTAGGFTTKQSWPSINGSTYNFVGSTAPGTLMGFTSPGPRRDGVQKPDVSAPGTAIVSALSGDAVGVPVELTNPDGVHWTLQGTSMSAPHVAGGIAVHLMSNGAWTPTQVKTRLYADALSDGYTGAVPNGLWGYGKFRMLINDATPPSVTVTQPNGGQTWSIGATRNILWTASDNVAVTAIDLAYSVNNGGTWTAIATGEPNDGSYAWVIPNDPSTQTLVRVTARDAANNSDSDTSDAVFTIYDGTPPVVAVTSPNGSETLPVGAVHNITWTATDNVGVTAIDLAYSVNNGGTWTAIATGEANDGTYAWTVPNAPTTQALVRVTAWDAVPSSAADASDAVFTIADTQAPSVTVTSPNGGETLAIGAVHNITWTATDNVGVTAIDLHYSIDNGGAWTLIATGEANDGSYDWAVPAPPTTQALVRVTARDAASNSGSDASDAVFTIADTALPVVTVLSPNGGETLAIGAVHNVTWTATDDQGVTSIDLHYSIDNGGAWIPIAAGEANDGTYAWTVPNAPTTHALVRVTAHDAALNTGSDASDAVFIIADTEDPAVAVTSPNGGESLVEGSLHAVTWTATDNVGVTAIDLHYSIDNGGTWTSIATGEANDGTYDWTVPAVATSQALVRVTAYDAATNSAADQSDAVFRISTLSSSPFLPGTITAPVVLQNRPNPFSPETRIGFGLPEPGHVSIRIYSPAGRLVRELADGAFGAGYTEIGWDGRSDAGTLLPSGVYFYRFQSGRTVVTRRMILER